MRQARYAEQRCAVEVLHERLMVDGRRHENDLQSRVRVK